MPDIDLKKRLEDLADLAARTWVAELERQLRDVARGDTPDDWVVLWLAPTTELCGNGFGLVSPRVVTHAPGGKAALCAGVGPGGVVAPVMYRTTVGMLRTHQAAVECIGEHGPGEEGSC